MTVYGEHGVFAGWPANHGGWQWGDEFLVGFMRGPYTRKFRSHQIGEPFEKLLARSVDGGTNWTVERPNVDFEARSTTSAPSFDMSSVIIRGCGVYDHGGDRCHPEGGFYLSEDRGRSWAGAYSLAGLGPLIADGFECTTRTCSVAGLLIVTRRLAGQFGTDAAFAVRHDGERFSLAGIVCDDGRRAAMPSAVTVGGKIVVALRRKDGKRHWIETFVSADAGVTWTSQAEVAQTSRKNGNPPALAVSGGVLACAYGDRDTGSVVVRQSKDHGYTWGEPAVIRKGGKSDIGYPQLFVRHDGDFVCVYYWAGPGEHQRIEATRFSPC